MSQTVVKRANYGLISTVAIKKAPSSVQYYTNKERNDRWWKTRLLNSKETSKWLGGVSYQLTLPIFSNFLYTNCYWISMKYFKSEESTFAFSIVHPSSAPPFSSLCIEGSKLHRRRRALAMKNSQLLFPIVNANASTLTTPLNFNHQNLGIKRQDSKDAHCRHPCTKAETLHAKAARGIERLWNNKHGFLR